MKTIFVLNGPNLNMLGKREPGIYGATSLAAIEKDCRATGESLDLSVDFRQSNHEGDLVDWIQEAGDAAAGVVYATDARASAKVRVAGIFPADSHRPIVYPVAAIVGAGPQASPFLSFLRSSAARAAFAARGFGVK